MPTKLCVGLSRKVGQPDFGSLGASCQLEIELNPAAASDPATLREQAERAFAACRAFIEAELACQEATSGPPGRPEPAERLPRRPQGRIVPGGAPGPRSATDAQIRAIRKLAARERIDLSRWLLDRFAVQQPGELSIRDASHAIDELKGANHASAR